MDIFAQKSEVVFPEKRQLCNGGKDEYLTRTVLFYLLAPTSTTFAATGILSPCVFRSVFCSTKKGPFNFSRWTRREKEGGDLRPIPSLFSSHAAPVENKYSFDPPAPPAFFDRRNEKKTCSDFVGRLRGCAGETYVFLFGFTVAPIFLHFLSKSARSSDKVASHDSCILIVFPFLPFQSKTRVVSTKYGRVQGFVSRVGRDAEEQRHVQASLSDHSRNDINI